MKANTEDETIEESPCKYGIESEMGTLEVQTHRVINEKGKVTYNTNTDFFSAVHAKERHRSSRFKELLYEFTSEVSFRKSEHYLNRIRQQEEGVKTTTLRNMVERDGNELREHVEGMLRQVLTENGFSDDGTKGEHELVPEVDRRTVDEPAFLEAVQKLEIKHPVSISDFENPEQSVDIAIDDVGVKRQSSSRPSEAEEKEKGGKKRKYAYQTVVHVSQSGKSFIFNAANQTKAAIQLLGLLLYNGLLWGRQLVFYVDGEASLYTIMSKYFGFLPMKFILDWYHVKKKVEQRLSSGMTGYRVRNPFMEKLLPFIWSGDIDGAIALLKALPEKQIKNIEHISKLIDYLDRNRGCIPCYAVRAELGLCNSSNKGEKANDIAVSKRQKHNGMSWSKEGSLGLASISAAAHNQELVNWAYHRRVDISLRKRPA